MDILSGKKENAENQAFLPQIRTHFQRNVNILDIKTQMCYKCKCKKQGKN